MKQEDYNDNVQVEDDEFCDVTKTKADYASAESLKSTTTKADKEKEVKETKTGNNQRLTVDIKNNLLELIKTNMPRLEQSLNQMIADGDYKGFASTMATLMKYGAPAMQSVQVDIEEGTQDSITKRLATLLQGKAVTFDD